MSAEAPTLPLPDGVNANFGSKLTEKANILVAQFGNSYSQRTQDGLNPIVGSFEVSFTPLLESECFTLINFFRTQGGYQAFFYTMPGESNPRLWTASNWSYAYVDGLIFTVTVTFTEQFYPCEDTITADETIITADQA